MKAWRCPECAGGTQKRRGASKVVLGVRAAHKALYALQSGWIRRERAKLAKFVTAAHVDKVLAKRGKTSVPAKGKRDTTVPTFFTTASRGLVLSLYVRRSFFTSVSRFRFSRLSDLVATESVLEEPRDARARELSIVTKPRTPVSNHSCVKIQRNSSHQYTSRWG